MGGTVPRVAATRTLAAGLVFGFAGWTAIAPAAPPDGASARGGSVVVLPAAAGPGGAPGERLHSDGFEVRLTRLDGTGEELVHPAGVWFEPPAGDHRAWLQDEWRVSPFSILIPRGATRSRGHTVTLPVAEGGRVVLQQELGLDPELILEILHARDALDRGTPRWEISARRPVGEIGDGVLLPAGPAIAALWSPPNRHYVALSRPFEVAARATVRPAFLERRAAGTHVVAEIRRHAVATTDEEYRVEVMLRLPAGDRRPDVEVRSADRIRAVWYGLEAGPAELQAGSPEAFLTPLKIDLPAASIVDLRGELRPLPALDVVLDLPSILDREPLSLSVRRPGTEEPLARHGLALAAIEDRFERLPPERLEVVLDTPLGPFSRPVDLSAGADGFVVLEPRLTRVRGTVYRGDRGHPADLSFTTVAGATTDIDTDAEGEYEVVLIEALRNVSIELDGSRGEPYLDFFTPVIEGDVELDFRLTAAQIGVRVLDAVSGAVIRGATVMFRNAYSPPTDVEGADAAGERERPKKSIAQQALTDGEGVAVLSPLRSGLLEVRASASGYSPLTEPMTLEINDTETDQRFDIELEPIGERVELRLMLSGGAPAAGTEVMLVDSLWTATPLVSDRSGPDGAVHLPRRKAGTVLVRHPAAGFLIADWRPLGEEVVVRWVLPAAAARPLAIRVVDASGDGPAPRAELALWVADRRLSGRVLAWLTGAGPVTDLHGSWIGSNLPAGPVAVLAWEPAARDQAGSGALDPLAKAVPYPWPDVVEVRAID